MLLHRAIRSFVVSANALEIYQSSILPIPKRLPNAGPATLVLSVMRRRRHCPSRFLGQAARSAATSHDATTTPDLPATGLILTHIEDRLRNQVGEHLLSGYVRVEALRLGRTRADSKLEPIDPLITRVTHPVSRECRARIDEGYRVPGGRGRFVYRCLNVLINVVRL